jgi:hypothetical protein
MRERQQKKIMFEYMLNNIVALELTLAIWQRLLI